MGLNLHSFDAFKGKQLQHVADQVQFIANQHHYEVNVLDPANGISGNIDVEPNRLNIWVDKDSLVTRFTVG